MGGVFFVFQTPLRYREGTSNTPPGLSRAAILELENVCKGEERKGAGQMKDVPVTWFIERLWVQERGRGSGATAVKVRRHQGIEPGMVD